MRNNKKSLHISPASLRAIAKQSRQTSLRHPEFISGSTNGTMWTLRQAQSDGAESFIKLASRIFTKSKNDKNGTWNGKIATGLSAPHNDNKKGNVITSATKQSRCEYKISITN